MEYEENLNSPVRLRICLRQVLRRVYHGASTQYLVVDPLSVRWMYRLLVAAVILDSHTSDAVRMRGGPKDQYYLLENRPRICSTVHACDWDAQACYSTRLMLVGSVNAKGSKGK